MKKLGLVGIFTALIATFLMSHNAGAINGWNSFQTFDLSTSNLSGANATINQSWFTSYTYGSNAASGSYSRLYNPVLYVSGNAMTVNKGQKFRIYLYGQAKHIQTAPDSGVFATNSFETDVLVRYSGNFVCTDDEVSLLVDPSGVFYSMSASNGFTFVHKLDCYATADGLQLHNLKLGGNLLKYQVYNDIQKMFSFDLQGKIVAYDDLNYEELVKIESAISTLGTKIDTTNTRLNTANTNLSNINNNIISSLTELRSIKTNTDDIADDVSAILNNSNTSAQKDAQDMQGYNNMQNTDGLINIGDQSGALSIVGSINSVLGQIESVPTAASCSILGNLGAINLGDLNFCQGKENFGAIVTFVATGIFLFISFFIVIRIIRRILRLIAWARSN